MTGQHWFDALAVALARGVSRKQVFRLAGAAALSLFAPRLPALAQQTRCRSGTDCPAELPDCCFGQCTSLQIDNTSCGLCGNNCLAQGRVCENGVCMVNCFLPKVHSGDGCVCPSPTAACHDSCCDPGQLCCPSGGCCAPDEQCCGGGVCCLAGSQVCYPNGDLLNGTRCCANDQACGDVCCNDSQECINGSCEKSCLGCAQDEVCCHVDYNAFCRAIRDLCGGQCCSPYDECASTRSDPNARVCCPVERHVCNGVCCDAGESCADDDGRCVAAPATLCRPPCDADSRCCGGSSSSYTSQCCDCCTVEKNECGRLQLLGSTLPDGSPARQCVAAGQLCPEFACGPGQSCCRGTSGTRHQCCGDDQACCDGRCCQPGDVCNAGQCVSLCPDAPCAPGQSCCRSASGAQQQCCGGDQACCEGRCCKPDEECKAGQCVPKTADWKGTWHAHAIGNVYNDQVDIDFTLSEAADGTLTGTGRGVISSQPQFFSSCTYTRVYSPTSFDVVLTGQRSDGTLVFDLRSPTPTTVAFRASACGSSNFSTDGPPVSVPAFASAARAARGVRVQALDGATNNYRVAAVNPSDIEVTASVEIHRVS